MMNRSRARFQLHTAFALLVSCAFLNANVLAQKTTLKVGDRAPAPMVGPDVKLISGPRVASFKQGETYVIEFWATWCGPCQRIAPLFAQLASEFPQAEFIKVDVDDNQETAQACQVSAMPTFMIFRDKKQVGMLRGADPNGLRALIQQHAGDKWSVAGEGQSLGSSQDTGEMSEREKRLAALERRGL